MRNCCDTCSDVAKYFCECTYPSSLMCAKHISNHIDTNIHISHCPQKIVLSLSSEDQKVLKKALDSLSKASSCILSMKMHEKNEKEAKLIAELEEINRSYSSKIMYLLEEFRKDKMYINALLKDGYCDEESALKFNLDNLSEGEVMTQLFKAGYCSLEIADSLINIASQHRETKKHTESIQYLSSAYKMAKTTKNQEYEAKCLYELGVTYFELNETEKAEKYLSDASIMNGLIFGYNHHNVAKCLNSLSSSYCYSHKYSDAIDASKEAIRIMHRVMDEFTPALAQCYDNLGFASFSLELYEEASSAYKQALRIKSENLGANDLEVAESFRKLGNAYLSMKNYDEAANCHEEVLRIKKFVHGNEHLEVAASLNELAFIYESLEKHQTALMHFNESLEIKKRFLEDNDAEIADVYMCIGIQYKQLRMYSDALEIFKETLRIRQGIQHKDLDKTLEQIAIVYQELGMMEETISTYNELLVYRRDSKWELGVADCLNMIGQAYGKMSKIKKGLSYSLESLKLRTKIQGNQGIDAVQTLYDIGWLYEQKKNYKKALEYQTSSFQILKKSNKKYNSFIIDIIDRIAINHFKLKQFKEAYSYLRLSLDKRQRYCPEEVEKIENIQNYLKLAEEKHEKIDIYSIFL